MIRQSRKTITTTMTTTADRFVTQTVTFDNTYPASYVGVMVPSPDDVSDVVLQVAPRHHRFNYPCLDGKNYPGTPRGYEENGIILEFRDNRHVQKPSLSQPDGKGKGGNLFKKNATPESG